MHTVIGLHVHVFKFILVAKTSIGPLSQIQSQEVKDVGRIPTRVLSLKNRVGDGHTHPLPLLVIIPGSPGMRHFYIPSCSPWAREGMMFQLSPMLDTPLDTTRLPPAARHLKATKSHLLMELQIGTVLKTKSHKLAFNEEEGKARDSIVLIGHSIGCWMILQMLQRMNTARIAKVFLLFPTIEKMGVTPNGRSILSYLWSSLRKPFTGLVWLSSRLIPNVVKESVLSVHFRTTPRHHLLPITQGVMNIDEKSMYNILQMAKQEMGEVVEPPLKAIDENIDKIVFYYGVGDNWNVESCYRDMAARYPGKQILLCESNIDHAFVECSFDEMAEFIYSKLQFEL